MADNRVQIVIEALNRTDAAVQQARRNMDEVGGGADKVKKSILDMNMSFSQVAGGAASMYLVQRGISAAVEAANRLESAMVGLATMSRFAGAGMQEAQNAALKLSSDGLMSVAESSRALQNLLSRGFGLDEAIALITRFKDSAAFGRQASLQFGEAVVSASEGLKNENSILVDNAGVTKNVSIMWKEYAAQIGKSITDLTQAEKRQAEYNGIMAETEGQLGNAARMADTFQGKQAKLNQEIEMFSATVGKTLQPALEGLMAVGKAVMNSFVVPFVGGLEILGTKTAAWTEKIGVLWDMLTKKITVGQANQRFNEINALVDEEIARTIGKWEGALKLPDIGKDPGKRRKDVVLPDEGGKKKEKETDPDTAYVRLLTGLKAYEDEKKRIEEESLKKAIDSTKATFDFMRQQREQALREEEQNRAEMMQHLDTYFSGQREKALAGMDMEREALRMKREMGDIDAVQELEALRQLEEQKFQVMREYMDRKLRLQEEGSIGQEQVQEEIARLEERHRLESLRNANAVTLAVCDKWAQVMSGVTRAFETSVQGIILGTTTLRQAMGNIAQAILGEFVAMGVRMVVQWVANMIAAKTASAGKITGYAAEAAAAAYAATAIIPIIGPVIAPGAAATAYAGTMAYLPLAFAEKGFDVDRDQLAYIHKNEMVLPAPLAERVRGMTEPGGGVSVTVNYAPNVQGLDGPSVKRIFRAHAQDIADAVKMQVRNFQPAT